MVNYRYTSKQLKRLRDQAYEQKIQWWNLLEKTYRASQPNRDVFFNRAIGTRQYNAGNVDSGYQGRNIAAWTYDLTLSYCTKVLVSKYVNLLFGIGKQWAQLVPGFEHYEVIDKYDTAGSLAILNAKRQGASAEELEQMQLQLQDKLDELQDNLNEAKKHYQKLTNKLFRYLHMSNFDLVNSEALYDMVASTGTYVLSKGTKNRPFCFESIPPDTIYMREGPYGTIDAYFRDFIEMDLFDAQDIWPGFVKPPVITPHEDTGEMTCNLMQATYYDPHFTKNKDGEEEGRWITQVITQDASFVCWERIEKTCCYITYREHKLAGEVYGRGTAMLCMPAACTIDVVMQNEIKAQELMGNPMWMAAGDGIFNPNTFQPRPGAVIAVNFSIAGTFPIQPLSPAGNPQLTAIVLSDIREQISRMMLVDPFDTNGPQKTATEVSLESNLNIETASPNIARINYDCINQLFPRMIEILQELGLWGPDELDGNSMAVHLQLPSEISQGVKEVKAIRDAHAVTAQMYGPDMAAGIYKIQETAPYIAQCLGVNLETVLSKKEIVQNAEHAEEQMQAQQEEQLALAQEQATK